MPYYAKIVDGVVRGVTQTARPMSRLDLVELDSLNTDLIGYSWDGQDFTPPPPTVYERITVGAFWDRFTNAELVDYDVAMQHDPAATNAAKKAAAKLRIFRRDVGEVGSCKLTGNKVRNFVQDLETTGILAAGRAAAILDAPITEDEKA